MKKSPSKNIDWLGQGSRDAFPSLFVTPEEKPPLPVWDPPKGKYGGDLRVVYSYKMKRDFNLCYPLEFFHFLMLDLDPFVVWICERPVRISAKIDGKNTSTIFDMWILWADGSVELREVKPEENQDKSQRQITLQERWSELIGIKHKVVTDKLLCREPMLENCRRMHPYLSQHPGAEWELKVLANVDGASPFPLISLCGSTYLDTQKLIHAAMHLVWRGDLISPLETKTWENLTLERPAHDFIRKPYC